MANGGYRYYGGPQPSPGYNPYSKHPDWGSFARELGKNLQMMKQMRDEKIYRNEKLALDFEELRRKIKADEVTAEHYGKKTTFNEALLKIKEKVANSDILFNENATKIANKKVKLIEGPKPLSIPAQKYLERLGTMSKPRLDIVNNMIEESSKALEQMAAGFKTLEMMDPLEKENYDRIKSFLDLWLRWKGKGSQRRLTPNEWSHLLGKMSLIKAMEQGPKWINEPVPAEGTLPASIGKEPPKRGLQKGDVPISSVRATDITEPVFRRFTDYVEIPGLGPIDKNDYREETLRGVGDGEEDSIVILIPKKGMGVPFKPVGDDHVIYNGRKILREQDGSITINGKKYNREY